MKKSTSVVQRLKSAPQNQQLEPNLEHTMKGLSMASDFQSGAHNLMKAIDAGFQASLRQPSEGIQSQSEPAEQVDHAPSCRTILPKQQRSEQLQKSSGHATRPRRSQAASKHPSMGANHSTLIEYLETFGDAMRPRQLAALLGIGRSTLYEWADAKTIPSYKHRGVVFFDPAIIAIWLRQQEV